MPRTQPKSFDEAFLELKQEYRAARETRFTSRMRGVSATGSNADYHYRSESDYLKIIERSRHYVRNDMVVGQAVRRLVSNIVQAGFVPDPKTGDDDLDKALKAEHQHWAADPDLCHSEGELTFAQMERLALNNATVDGDIFFLLRNDDSLQAVEADRPRTPRNTRRNVVHGVLMDDNRRRTEVWITKHAMGLWQRPNKVSDVVPYRVRDASGNRQVVQVYFPMRFSQTRGVGALAPVSDTVGMHDDLQFNTIVKANMASLVMMFREQTKESLPGGGGPALGSGLAPAGEADNGGQEAAEFRPIPLIKTGLDVRLPPGETAKGFTPNIPNPEFFPHSSLLLTFIAVNLDMPLQMMLLDPTKTNFSGWRGAIDQARTRFREIQTDMMGQFHRPVWNWRVRNLIASVPSIRKMASRTGVRPFAHDWQLPAWPYIEPMKDAQSDDLQITRFLNSPRRQQAARGREWEVVAPEIVNDKGLLIDLAIAKAAEINAKYPEAGVTWREILGPGLTSNSPVVQAAPEAIEATA